VEVEEKTLKSEYPFLRGDFHHVNIGSDDKTQLRAFIQVVMDMVRNNPAWNNQEMTAYGYQTKKALREHFIAQKSNYINMDMFAKIAMDCGTPKEELDFVLDELNVLGMCLRYKNEKGLHGSDTLVLNPEWIAHGIYKIINIGRDENKRSGRKHILKLDDGKAILGQVKEYEYPPYMAGFLFELMVRYKLAYYKDSTRICIPGILPLDQPDGLMEFDNNKCLTIRFEVGKVLPLNNAVASLIVHRHDYGEVYDEDFLWRKGAQLRYGNDTYALVKEDGNGITVNVIGPQRTEYSASLRVTLLEIFNDYKSLNPSFSYKLLEENRSEPHRKMDDIFIPEGTIKAHVEENLPYLVPTLRRTIDLSQMSEKYGVFIYAPNYGTVSNSQTTTTTINQNTYNFHQCAVELQDEMTDVIKHLQSMGKETKDLESIIEDIDTVGDMAKDATEAELVEKLAKRPSLVARIKEFFPKVISDIEDALLDAIVKIKNGGKIAKNLLFCYTFLSVVLSMFFNVPDILPPLPDNLQRILKGH